MRSNHLIGWALATLLIAGSVSADVGTAFTYQAQLKQGGQAYNGAADLTFRLFDALAGGIQVGPTLDAPATPISQGQFTMDLDFGVGVFDGAARWLQIEINGVVLAPRQPIMPVPYAMYTVTGPGLGGGGASWAFRGDEITTADSVDIINEGLADFALDVRSDYSAGGTALIQNSGGGIGLSVRGDGALEGISFADSGFAYGVYGLSHSPEGKAGWFRAEGGGYAGYFEGKGYFQDNVGIGTASPESRLHLAHPGPAYLIIDADTNNAGGEDQNARLLLRQDGGAVTVRVGFGTNNDLHIFQEFNDDMILGTNDTERMRIKAGGNIGIGTNSPTGRLHVIDISGQPALKVQGIAQVTLLEITGADVAEKFPVSEATTPGTVMAIDPEHPGSLCVARGAYNRRVAGVVSGANDLPAGAILGNLPGCEDAPPIALSGRVWVKCDASNGAIGVGDLLTTSDTPGHAMGVGDHSRAPGAVIGKAMTALDEGTGLVLVLVSLQ